MSNYNTNDSVSQESLEDYQARITAPGYKSAIIVPDEEPLSQDEYLPALVDTLCPIANSLDSIDNGIGYLCDIFERLLEAYQERTEALQEQNRLRAKEPTYSAYNENSPFKPPTGRGFTKPMLEMSPGAKRLRNIEKEGHQL